MNEREEDRLQDATTGSEMNRNANPRESATRATAETDDISGFSRYVDFDVVDRADHKIGTLHSLWVDRSGQPAFLSVKTGWLFGKNHVVPADAAEVNAGDRKIRLAYDEDTVKNAPAFDPDKDLDLEAERQICDYYHVGGTQHEEAAEEEAKPRFSTTDIGATETAPRFSQGQPEEARIQLSEEELRVGKRQVEAGGVRLRKVIRTETVNQPVELAREEIVIERVPASGAQPGDQNLGEQQSIFIPLRREEAVIGKEAHVREEVRARKRTDVERENISESVRKEDVEVEREGEANRSGSGSK